MQRHIRKSAYGAGRMAAAERLRAVNKKFAVGENPLEREQKLPVIMPTNQQQLESMIKMLEDLYGNNPTEQQKQAMELWKFQVAQGTVGDQIKFDFVRSFYFWLLGRGSDVDHKNTSWQRANVAVYNPEVAAYIDQFAKKRMDFAVQLSLLKSRIPETLLGYYLYFKYIVRGKLELRTDKETGYSFYDISNEDFLQDWDLFKNVFDEENQNGTRARDRDGYADIAAGLRAPQGYAQFEGAVPFPATSAAVDRRGRSGTPASNLSLQPQDLEEKRVSQLDQSLHISRAQQKIEASESKSQEEQQVEGTLPVRDESDLGTPSSIAPQTAPGTINDSGFAQPFTPSKEYDPDKDSEVIKLRERLNEVRNITDDRSQPMSGVKSDVRSQTHITGLTNATNDLIAFNARIADSEKRVDAATPLRNEGRRREEGRDSSVMTPIVKPAIQIAAQVAVEANKVGVSAEDKTKLASILNESIAELEEAASKVAQQSEYDKKLVNDSLAKMRRLRAEMMAAKLQQRLASISGSSDIARAAEYGEGGSVSYGSMNSSELRDVSAIDENINRQLFEAAQAEANAAAHGSEAVDESEISAATEQRSGNVSNLIADEMEEEVPVNSSSSSTSTSSHASDEKSGYVSVHSDTGDNDSSLHLPPADPTRHDVWLPKGARWIKPGKVFVEPDGKHVVKFVETKAEKQQRIQFYKDNPELTVPAESVTVVGRSGEHIAPGLRMSFMKGFVSLRQLDKKSLTGMQKDLLGQALFHAYSNLKYASYSDVTNLDNIAVWQQVMPDGRTAYTVRFYEGGTPGKKPVKNSPDLARANYMARLRNEPGAVAIVNEFLGIKKATELRATPMQRKR